jgi:hypothetical protein
MEHSEDMQGSRLERPDGLEMHMTDALTIADSAARANLYVHGLEYVESDDALRSWLDLDTADEGDAEKIDLYVRYLSGRGLLERHKDNPNWVRAK